jgi:nitrogen fixation protein
MSLIRQLYSKVLIQLGWRLEIDDLTTNDNMYDTNEKITIVIQY